jgi:hypothetical protein
MSDLFSTTSNQLFAKWIPSSEAGNGSENVELGSNVSMLSSARWAAGDSTRQQYRAVPGDDAAVDESDVGAKTISSTSGGGVGGTETVWGALHTAGSFVANAASVASAAAAASLDRRTGAPVSGEATTTQETTMPSATVRGAWGRSGFSSTASTKSPTMVPPGSASAGHVFSTVNNRRSVAPITSGEADIGNNVPSNGGILGGDMDTSFTF